MRNVYQRLLFTGFLLFMLGASVCKGQALTAALNNPVIMSHYTAQQLQDLAANDTNELNAIVYYYTASFTVHSVACFDCLPFDSAMFDISKFEHLRLEDSAYTREFTKYGFTLTLLPVNELPYEYAIHQVPRIDPGENKQTN